MNIQLAPLPTGAPPERFATEVAVIETELNAIWPPWRTPQQTKRGMGIEGSMGIDDLALKVRVKYLLQVRAYRLQNRDWDAQVIQVGPGKLLAIPLRRRALSAEDIEAAARTSLLPESPDEARSPAPTDGADLSG